MTTKPLWNHLQREHPAEYNEAKEEQQKGKDAKKIKVDEKNDKMAKYVLTQPTIQQTLDKNQVWPKSNPDQLLGEQLMIQWLADDMLPYRAVDNDRFTKMLNHLNKKFVVPSEKVVRQRLMPELYRKIQYHIKMSLDKNIVGVYAITTDIWTARNKAAFISYTAHFITVDWERKVAILRCMPYDETHSGASIASVLGKMGDQWGLGKIHCIVRDNGANVVSGCTISGTDHIGCLDHTLSLIIKHSIEQQSGVKNMRKRLRKVIKILNQPKAVQGPPSSRWCN